MGEMWNRVDWMKPVDTAIVQFLTSRSPIKLSPTGIAVNIDYDAGYVGSRCSILVEHELLKQHDDLEGVYYSTTPLGDRFSAGELSADDLREDEDDE